MPEAEGDGRTNRTIRGMRLPDLPSLDGLRALAVIAVLLFHADLGFISGGFLGVEVFFVISGYLITSLLLAEWRRSGRVDLKAFWLRRARRLLPAMYLVIAVALAFSAVFLPDEVTRLRGDAMWHAEGRTYHPCNARRGYEAARRCDLGVRVRD